MEQLSDLLQIPRGLTAVIGSGGKTSLIRVLAEELSDKGNVLLLTTTKIWPPDFCPVLTGASAETVREAFLKERIVCAGEPVAAETPEGLKSKLTAPAAPIGVLSREADYVLLEADGSKQRPLKAHLSHEPVIPPGAGTVIQVVGVSGIGRPVSESVHRPERFLELLGEDDAGPESPVTPEALAKVISREIRGDILFINGVETPEQRKNAGLLAESVRDLHYRRVISGSIKERNYRCLY